MRLFNRLLWLGPLVVLLVVCGTLVIVWAASQVFGFAFDISTVCAIGAIAGGLIVAAYIWKYRAAEAAHS